jgi:tripartite-type tricarboxylate transporter receptor subunit TctC
MNNLPPPFPSITLLFSPHKCRQKGLAKRLVSTATIAGLATALATFSSASWAQADSRKPVTLVVPFVAGGATDNAARLLAVEIAKSLDRTVLVDNRPGAAGALGANFVAKSQPDGTTICLCGGGPMVILPLLDSRLGYVPTRDLAPVILSHLIDYVMVVRADSPHTSLAKLVAAAKTQPGRISYGSTGSGGPAHLGMELFKRVSGSDFLHVPYKGESNVTTDLLGGQIDIGLLSVQASIPMIAAGKVRAVGVWSATRAKALPQVPTVAEQGWPEFSAGTFIGINVASGTPAPVVEKLYSAFDAALKKPAVRDKLQEQGFTPMALPPAAYAAFLHREQVKWAKVIADTGLKGRE